MSSGGSPLPPRRAPPVEVLRVLHSHSELHELLFLDTGGRAFDQVSNSRPANSSLKSRYPWVRGFRRVDVGNILLRRGIVAERRATRLAEALPHYSHAEAAEKLECKSIAAVQIFLTRERDRLATPFERFNRFSVVQVVAALARIVLGDIFPDVVSAEDLWGDFLQAREFLLDAESEAPEGERDAGGPEGERTPLRDADVTEVLDIMVHIWWKNRPRYATSVHDILLLATDEPAETRVLLHSAWLAAHGHAQRGRAVLERALLRRAS